MRLPSSWLVTTGDRKRLLKREVKPGMRYLEIGCAPGKMLVYVAKQLGAITAGLDYSPRGIAWTRRLFDSLGVAADLRCEDVFQTSFEPGSFDVVHSGGVIEHFEDPTEIVRIHVRLLKPGGVALISIPNLAGAYKRLVEYFDLEAVGLHNLRIMNREALKALAPHDLAGRVSVYSFGRVSLDFIDFRKKLPQKIAASILYLSNMVGLAQPFDIPFLCPHLILRIVSKEEPGSAQ